MPGTGAWTCAIQTLRVAKIFFLFRLRPQALPFVRLLWPHFWRPAMTQCSASTIWNIFIFTIRATVINMTRSVEIIGIPCKPKSRTWDPDRTLRIIRLCGRLVQDPDRIWWNNSTECQAVLWPVALLVFRGRETTKGKSQTCEWCASYQSQPWP